MMNENENEPPPPLVWPPVGMLPCPKEDCPRLFTSRADMEAHQMAYDDHPFCMGCNIQFQTHEELFLHRLISKRHRACPICNRSFDTDDGRDFHIQKVGYARSLSPKIGPKNIQWFLKRDLIDSS